MQAVRKHAMVPDMKALKATAAKSDLRSGAMEESVASCTPMLPGLALGGTSALVTITMQKWTKKRRVAKGRS